MASTKIDESILATQLRSPETVRSAFNEVIKLYSEPLYWQIRRLVPNHDDANDLLQNTFLRAWSSIENFRGEAKLSTWLHKIAINESLTFIERERKRQKVSLDDCEVSVANNIAADTELDGENLIQHLHRAIALLPEKQRLVFNMKYFDEMKYEEISEIMGTSVGALKASYHLATKKIEQYFDELD